jgi:hypothetical protein
MANLTVYQQRVHYSGPNSLCYDRIAPPNVILSRGVQEDMVRLLN